MAAVNLLIGVGGTGAKVVEAALINALAGWGPRDLSVAFVDQDESNGNVRRARELLRQSELLRTLWIAGGRPDRWDASSPVTEGGSLLGSVAARSIDPAHDLWAPHTEEGTTLGSIFSSNVLAREEPRLKSLMDALYAPDASEQGMELSEGYRGRPHIGAAAILSRAEQDAPFWRSLREILRRAQGGQEVRVFLIGSVFGGTGAAGFPTLARTLRDMARDATGQAPNVRVGGALMLPYFGFAPPPDDQANVAKPEHLLRQSRAALKYYHDLFRREHVFDELYLTGWNPPFQLGYFAPGSNAQANPPLLPELIAAASAVRFFDAARERPDDVENATFISARNAPDAFGWNDIPAVAPGREAEPYERLGQLLRFCAAWRNTIRPSLKSRLFGGDPWYHKQGAKAVKYDRPETVQNLDALDDTVERVLEWAAGVQLFATTAEFGPPGVPRFGLWDVSPMSTFSPRSDPTRPAVLRQPLTDGGAALDAYRRIVSARDEVARPPDQGALFNEINVAARPGAHEGLGRIVAAVHHAARLTDTGAAR